MSYLTEAKLASIVDVPVALPATEIRQGDWLVFASIKLVPPQQLRFRFLNLQLLSASVATADIENGNLIYGNLGFAYVVLRRDYLSGSPGSSGALDTLIITQTGVVARDLTNEMTFDTPGTYSWILANNCKANSATAIPTYTSIDFRISVTGQVRLELEAT